MLALRESLRRRKHRAQYVHTYPLTPYAGATVHVAPEVSPEELYGHREALEVALEELNAMDARLLAVFIAVDLEGLTEAEAAEEFGIPLPTVKSRLRRARAFAKETLEPRSHELLVILPPAFVAALFSGEAHAATPTKERRRPRRPRSAPAVTPPKITPSNIVGPASIGATLSKTRSLPALRPGCYPDRRRTCQIMHAIG